MAKRKKYVTVASHMSEESLAYWKLDKDHLYEYVKGFWFNGEGHYNLIDKDGTIKDWPDIFFNEPQFQSTKP